MSEAIIFHGVMDDIELEVTPEDIERGYVEFECPACEGTGEAFWHPLYPEGDIDYGCVECSTRGTRVATLW